MKNYIQDCYAEKAQYLSGEEINIIIELYNTEAHEVHLEIRCDMYYLTDLRTSIPLEIGLKPGKQERREICFGPMTDDFSGYGVDFQVFEGEEQVQTCSTAFDVVSDWKKAPRYGFLSDFDKGQKGDMEDILNMRKFHINLVQFYDWMYRHDDLIPPGDEFTDLMGRTLSYGVVKEKIKNCHRYGMKTMAYGAVYGASNDFYEKHKDWAFYTSLGEPYDFINIFKIMNILPQSPWHEHIIGEYYKAIEQADFDGIHMDTYGFPKTAISVLNGIEEAVCLEDAFPGLIDHTREKLDQTGKDICLIFNNVGNWPVDTVAGSQLDAIYIEVWKPYERYFHIQQIIRQARQYNKHKPVILAAYLKPFSEKGIEERRRAQNAALILTSAIIANGGYHLLLGENNGVLTEGYYASYSAMDSYFADRLRVYYDFLVRYQNILYDAGLRDVSMTHIDGDNMEYRVEGCSYSAYGESNKVWVILREKPCIKTIQFINLTGNGEDYWNAGKEEPVLQKDIFVRAQVTGIPKQVYLASPDFDMGRPQSLEYTIESEKYGKQLAIKVSELSIYNLIVIEL